MELDQFFVVICSLKMPFRCSRRHLVNVGNTIALSQCVNGNICPYIYDHSSYCSRIVCLLHFARSPALCATYVRHISKKGC